MFSKKNDKNSGKGASTVLGALAAVGAISIVKKGKELFCKAKRKMSSCLGKECQKSYQSSFSEDGFSYSDGESDEGRGR